MWRKLDKDRKSVIYDLIGILAGGAMWYSYLKSAHSPNPSQVVGIEILMAMGPLLVFFWGLSLLLDLRKIAKSHQ